MWHQHRFISIKGKTCCNTMQAVFGTHRLPLEKPKFNLVGCYKIWWLRSGKGPPLRAALVEYLIPKDVNNNTVCAKTRKSICFCSDWSSCYFFQKIFDSVTCYIKPIVLLWWINISPLFLWSCFNIVVYLGACKTWTKLQIHLMLIWFTITCKHFFLINGLQFKFVLRFTYFSHVYL